MPDYFVFNRRPDRYIQNPHRAKRRARPLLRGLGRPTHPCNFHVAAEQFDYVRPGTTSAPPIRGVPTFAVPPGGGMVFDFAADVTGEFPFVNPGFGHGQKGAIGFLVVEEQPGRTAPRRTPALACFPPFSRLDTRPHPGALCSGPEQSPGPRRWAHAKEGEVMRRVRWQGSRGACLAATAAMLVATTAGPLGGQEPTTSAGAPARVETVRVVEGGPGVRLQVDGRDFQVRGVNWDYFPVGTNYAYDFWRQPDAMIEAALERDMSLLRGMGVNAIRVYAGIPPRWVRHIHDRYGIYTALNHPMGRYGTTVGGVFQANTNYSDPATRAALLGELRALVREFEGVPGVLMWLLGNENNYGLAWRSAETQALPSGERDAARARHLYSLFGEAVRLVHEADPRRPVGIVNGDIQYLDIIAQEVPELDVFGSNVYRGMSAGDLFERVWERLKVPVVLTEFGADAFNARTMQEDQLTQARYLLAQWRELYLQSAGKGGVGNAIGGFTFQWTDGWWKFGQEDRLDVQDANASWPNAAYAEDFVAGQNNMNEEWWGIAAKGAPDHRGVYDVYPRAAYYVLRDAYALDPYDAAVGAEEIRAHFDGIEPAAALLTARGNSAARDVDLLSRVRLADLRVELETYSTGGEYISTPENRSAGSETMPAFQGFDTKQSVYAAVEAAPAPNLLASLALNVLGNVPTNPIDQIFYENRGRTRTVVADGTPYELRGIERIAVYGATVSWDEPWFHLDGFYRTGHFHWGYEGDFFGLYREANYGPALDTYNGLAPFGVEIEGRRALEGATLAFGPELWWGANPSVMGKLTRRVGPFQATLVAQEDIAEKSEAAASFAIPVPPTRKVALSVATTWRDLGVELGGLWSGSTKEGEVFQVVEGEPGSYRVLQDEVRAGDALGGKMKLSYTRGRWNWYAQAAAMGLVADAGPTATLTYTGWSLKDSGSGNQYNVLTGLAVNVGRFQVAPNFLWQKPIIGPVPANVPVPGRPRNILDDPFAVRANRETVAGELLLTFDPTPATWLWAWDNDIREDASLAGSLGIVFRHHPTTMDAAIGILGDGRTTFAFPGATPARDLWEVRGRVLSKHGRSGVVANFFAGTGEPNGDDERLIHRYGGDLRLIRGAGRLIAGAKVNDWGPYDYHRDFNLTFPLQLLGDVSYVLGRPGWLNDPETRVGVRGTWRSLDEYSPRYCPQRVADGSGTPTCAPTLPGPAGSEWEIRTYLHIAL